MYICISTSKIPKLKENDLFITGVDILIRRRHSYGMDRTKNKFEINPFVRIISKKIND